MNKWKCSSSLLGAPLLIVAGSNKVSEQRTHKLCINECKSHTTDHVRITMYDTRILRSCSSSLLHTNTIRTRVDSCAVRKQVYSNPYGSIPQLVEGNALEASKLEFESL